MSDRLLRCFFVLDSLVTTKVVDEMKISVNNKEVETVAVSISTLVKELSLPMQGVAVAVDNRLVPRTEWADYALAEGMNVVIIKAACGG